MMKAAQRGQVGRFGLAAIRPVFDVMHVDVARVRAAGEATALVAGDQEASKWGGNRSRLAPDVERFAFVAFDQSDEARVAGKSTRGFRSHRRAVLVFATPRRPVTQSFRGDVHDNLMAIGAGAFGGGVGQETFGHQGEGVRA